MNRPEPPRLSPGAAMRKTDKEITGRADIEAILSRAPYCRLALCADGQPYIVPLNFGYDPRRACLYFHTGPRGLKIDYLSRNHRACFEVDEGVEVIRAATPCRWSMKYASVIGFGRVVLVTDEGEKRQALDTIAAHVGAPAGDYPPELVAKMAIIRFDIDTMTGRRPET